MSNKDSLGDRMKSYENINRTFLTPRTNTIIRVDGRAFHSYTKGLEKPYDIRLMEDMDQTAIVLCQSIPGAKMAYVQSDEISIILTDYDEITTEAWFNGNIQKICSISASIATTAFNNSRLQRKIPNGIEIVEATDDQILTMLVKLAHDIADQKPAHFDSRCFIIPDKTEVYNYFLWRQQDATRNSISMAAQCNFSHNRLQGVSSQEMQELLWKEKDINWNDYPVGYKRGRAIIRVAEHKNVVYEDKHGNLHEVQGAISNSWKVVDPPVFNQEPDFILKLMP